MNEIQDRIAKILEVRRGRLPTVQKEVERWTRLDDEIGVLATVVDELRGHPHTPTEIREGLSNFQTEDIRKGIASVMVQLRVLEARFARGTINIGVSGRARVGKSTLLQSMSGLTDDQIPTGSGLPVTAVRSRIFHSNSHQRAILSLHTFQTFRDEILQPYHAELDLPSTPLTLGDFKSWKYPASIADLPESAGKKHSSVAILRRLREMQQALWSYEADLTGGEREVDLRELRQYVAYPTDEQIDARCARCYLAIRDVRIDCTFPYSQINHLGIIDLPGLGELAANAEEHHLNGLQNEVDMVLLVKRPVEGMAYWGREDAAATDLLNRARGFVKSSRDFSFIVLNSGGSHEKLATDLRNDIRRSVNDDVDGRHFKVLEGDATNQRSVQVAILTPVLTHLAERLPVMDDEVYEGTRAAYIGLTAKVNSTLRDLESALRSASRSDGSATENLEYRTVELRQDLAGVLAELVTRFQSVAKSGEEDPQFLASVEASYDDIQCWISNGFGTGKEAWCTDALRRMRVDRNSSPVAAHELNRIRVEISKRYRSLDTYFHHRVEQLWESTAKLLKSHLGELLTSVHSGDALRSLAQHLANASEPCPTMSDAVTELLALRLDYRTTLHPRVRRELDGLNLQVRNPKGELEDQIVVEVSEAGVDRLYGFLSQLAEQAAYSTKKALIMEALTPDLVLYAAAEQFEDALIRSGDAEREFRRFARSFRDEIWPSVFQGIDEANVRYSKVSRAIRVIHEQLNNCQQGQA